MRRVLKFKSSRFPRYLLYLFILPKTTRMQLISLWLSSQRINNCNLKLNIVSFFFAVTYFIGFDSDIYYNNKIDSSSQLLLGNSARQDFLNWPIFSRWTLSNINIFINITISLERGQCHGLGKTLLVVFVQDSGINSDKVSCVIVVCHSYQSSTNWFLISANLADAAIVTMVIFASSRSAW